MTSQQKQKIKDDVTKYEKGTGHSFRTAHYWDSKKENYNDRVTFADVT